jgi:hypothetical protein
LAARLACTASNKSRARIGSCSPRCRLLENPVKLPFLNVELPLVAFFFLAPIIFIVSHAYTLVHFVMLGAKVGVYDDDLRPQLVDAVVNRSGGRYGDGQGLHALHAECVMSGRGDELIDLARTNLWRWHCHAASGLRWRFCSQGDEENQLSRLPLSARDHPAGDLRFTLSLRDVEDLLAERGIMVSYEIVRRWVNHSGP